jgi:outer membrane protein W
MNRRAIFLTIAFMCSVAGFSTAAFAGLRPAAPEFLAGRHSLFFNAGLRLNTGNFASISANGVNASSGLISAIGYGYWFDNDWSLNFSVGVFSPEASVGSQGVAAGMIVPIQFGLRYYPSFLMLGSVGRPYIGASAGSYLQMSSGIGGSGVSAGSQAVLGGQLTAGVDLFVANWLRFGPSVSYHAVGDFPVSRKNYSGAEFSLNAGIVF